MSSAAELSGPGERHSLAGESPAIDEGRATDDARVRGRPLRDDLDGQPAERPYPGGIPEATVARLPVYLRALYTLAERGVSTVASDELSTAAGVNSAKLRKDLSYLGSYGIRGVGYDVEYLVYQVSRALGLTENWPVVIVGAQPRPRAGELRRVHLPGVPDIGRAGQRPGPGWPRARLGDRPPCQRTGGGCGQQRCRDRRDRHAAGAAQAVCDRLVAAGVTSILNFAPLVLTVPAGVDVRKVDLSIELQILAFHAQRRSAERFGQVAGPAVAEA